MMSNRAVTTHIASLQRSSFATEYSRGAARSLT
jgi:hypothetical protein